MQQETALALLKQGKNIFLTGAAGSGKTYVLNHFIKYLDDMEVCIAVTASTGIAATHIGGQTIHSWSGIGIKDKLDDYELEKVLEDRRIKRNYKNCKVLIIDEISMLHAEQLDMVDRIARGMLYPDKPFGGLQVVFCGDFFQLPPVARNNQNTKFAFEAKAWKAGDLTVCYLTEQHRQNNDPLLSVLNAIRAGSAGEEAKIPLRTRYKKEPQVDKSVQLKATVLYAKNVNVDALNDIQLKELSGEAKIFKMSTKGFSKFVDNLKKNCLAPEILKLKIGAQVMFVKNSPTGEYVNGTRGIVTGFSKSEGVPLVKTSTGYTIEASPVDWNYADIDTVRATISQIPLRLAWAVTIHKSQGMTLDAVEVDLSDAFEPGMGYVALSRVRTLNGLKLMGLNEMALRVNEKVSAVDFEFQALSEKAEGEILKISKENLQYEHLNVLKERFSAVKFSTDDKVIKARKRKEQKKKEPKIPSHEITAQLLSEKLKLQEIAVHRAISVRTVLSHLEKLKGLKKLPDVEYLKNDIQQDDFDKILTAFKSSDDGKLQPVFEKFSGQYAYETLQFVRLYVL